MKGKAINVLLSSILSFLGIALLLQLKGVPEEGTHFPGFLIYALLLCSVFLFIRAFLPKLKTNMSSFSEKYALHHGAS